MPLADGQRQVAPDLDGIRRDHVARYQWAAGRLEDALRVLDVACGVGYGAALLADRGFAVTAVDNDPEALAYARLHYQRPTVTYLEKDAAAGGFGAEAFDVATCFETIEHVEDPLPMLQALRAAAPRLLASVPNEAVFPFRNHLHHFRHYTAAEFEALLAAAGWRVVEWWGQEGPDSDLARDVAGRTLVAVAERGEVVPLAPPAARLDHVAILGLGPSLEQYVDIVKRLGGRHRFADEVWGINAVGGVLQCDRVFHMDDVRIQEIRAAAAPRSNIAVMLEWLKRHPGPVYTSFENPAYPGLVAYPLEDVINATGFCYFNNTAPYAVAYALYRCVKKISLFGCDYTYRNAHDSEQGRACLEFWLGIAAARGVELVIAERSSLMDSCEPDERRVYGYDCAEVSIVQKPGEGARVVFTPRAALPTAAEIEARYDHTRHPSPQVRAAQEGAKS